MTGDDPILMEALEWLVRLRDSKAGADERRAFERWVDQGEPQRVAWAKAQALWTRFDIVKPEIKRLRRSQRALTRRKLMIAGGALLAAAGAHYVAGRRDLFADAATDIGERRTFALADGSAVELGSYSALSLNFTAVARQVELYRGEGFFEVAPDPSRPFTVMAADGTTEAIGTKFDVKYVDDLVTVSASERALMVRVGAAPPLRIEPGFQLSYGRDGPTGATPADPVSVEAWRQDRMVFQDVPLRRVLAELERYRRGRIILMSRRIGDIPVTAVFSTRQADAALKTIADTLPIRVLQATRFVSLVYSI